MRCIGKSSMTRVLTSSPGEEMKGMRMRDGQATMVCQKMNKAQRSPRGTSTLKSILQSVIMDFESYPKVKTRRWKRQIGLVIGRI